MFTIRHIGRIEELSKSERYSHADIETVGAIVEEHGRFMNEVFAPINALGDRVGLIWSPDGVTTPAEFKPAYHKFVEAGWQGVAAETQYGGAGFPMVVFAAAQEFMTAANGALSMCPGLTIGAIEALEVWGSEEQKETYLRKLTTGEWAGTMNLTEPQAGSDVGLCTTKAEPQPDGTYRLSGTKIFISFGEHDLTENIIHLVLARIPGAPIGTKGISLFIVPKFLVNDDGSLGEHNDVRCLSIERKMGIHASPTCVMSYGDDGGAIGYLVGEENQGMRAMFTMMNAARIAVGIQGLAMGDAAYQKALDYSRTRLQGHEIGSDSAGPAPIIAHPDVRRMLLTMRSQIEAMRALISYNSMAIDMARSQEGESAKRWQELGDLLTPVSKAWCTDLGMEVTSAAVQVFGGMGYVEESGVAQHFRDARIASIYEGANGIQAMDLVGRKLPIRMGGVVTDLIASMRSTVTDLRAAGDHLASIATNLAAGIDSLESTTNWILTNGAAHPVDALAGATPYLALFGTVAGGWGIAQLALAADAELRAGSWDTAYLEAKITSARFYAEQLLPTTAGYAAQVTSGASVLYEVDGDTLASI